MTASAKPRPCHRTPLLLVPFRVAFVLVRTVVMTAAAVLGGLAVALRWAAAGRAKSAVAAVPPTPVVLPPAPPTPAPPPLPVTAPRRPVAKPAKSGGGTGQRVLFIAAVVGFVAVVLSVADDGRRRVAPPPAPVPLRNLRPDRLQEYAADNAIVGGALVALAAHPDRIDEEPVAGPVQLVQIQPVPPVPPVPPAPAIAIPPVPTVRQPHSVVAARVEATAGSRGRHVTKPIKVRSEYPHPTQEAALADALGVAQRALADQLQELDPPVTARPSAEFVRRHARPEVGMTVRPTDDQRAAWVAAGLPPDQVWVELELTGLTSEEVRHLRAEERVQSAGKLAVVPFVLALALYGFLRFDAWTRGYLTVALGVGMAALAGGAVALIALVR